MRDRHLRRHARRARAIGPTTELAGERWLAGDLMLLAEIDGRGKEAGLQSLIRGLVATALLLQAPVRLTNTDHRRSAGTHRYTPHARCLWPAGIS
jgi:hypothetical protein